MECLALDLFLGGEFHSFYYVFTRFAAGFSLYLAGSRWTFLLLRITVCSYCGGGLSYFYRGDCFPLLGEIELRAYFIFTMFSSISRESLSLRARRESLSLGTAKVRAF
jgi:hypothetical protein